MVRGRDNWWYVFCLCSSLLCLKKVITNRTADHTFPMFLQENISRGVDQEKAMNHGEDCQWKREVFFSLKASGLCKFSTLKTEEAMISSTQPKHLHLSSSPSLNRSFKTRLKSFSIAWVWSIPTRIPKNNYYSSCHAIIYCPVNLTSG